MVSDPDYWIPKFGKAGANQITFHFEASGIPETTALLIRALPNYVKASVSIKPETPVERLKPLLDIPGQCST